MSLNMQGLASLLVVVIAGGFYATEVGATPNTPMEFRTFTPCKGNASFCATQILASGVIEKDSHLKLNAFIANAPKDAYLPPAITVVFDSPGGNLAGGLEMGHFIRKRGFDTLLQKNIEEEVFVGKDRLNTVMRVVASNTMCASACALAFLGGQTRAITPGSRLGVHQFYAATGSIGDNATQVAMTHLAIYIQDMGADRRMLDLASTSGPTDMIWLTDELIRDFQIDNTRFPLVPWRIDADAQGIPSLITTQRVRPNLELGLVFANNSSSIKVLVFAVVARDAAGLSRQDAFPAGQDAEISFKVDEKRVINTTASSSWQRLKRNSDGSVTYLSSAAISYSDFRAIAASRKLSVSDNFPQSIRDLSISTDLSVKNLAGGGGLLLRSGDAR